MNLHSIFYLICNAELQMLQKSGMLQKQNKLQQLQNKGNELNLKWLL